jgi:hypothetical protein
VLSCAVGRQWEKLGGGRDIQVWTDDSGGSGSSQRCAESRQVRERKSPWPGRTGKNALGKLTHR